MLNDEIEIINIKKGPKKQKLAHVNLETSNSNHEHETNSIKSKS